MSAYQIIDKVETGPVIDIGSRSSHPMASMLSYYDPTPKRLPDGKRCLMYAGYYYYLITVGDNSRFLRAEKIGDLDVKRKYDWTNVAGLELQLERALLHNLRISPLAIPYLVHNRDHQIVWNEDRPLRNAEQRWLRVVQRVVETIRREHAKK